MMIKMALVTMLFSAALQAASIDITNATVREPLPGRTLSSGYFSLKNTGQEPIALKSVTSILFGSVELHTHRMVDGMMQMTQLDQITIAAGEQLHLQPGGMHLMLFNPTETIQVGLQVPLELHWSDGTIQSVQATVTRIPKQ